MNKDEKEKEMNLFFFVNGVLRVTTHYVDNPDKKREIFLSKDSVEIMLKELLQVYQPKG